FPYPFFPKGKGIMPRDGPGGRARASSAVIGIGRDRLYRKGRGRQRGWVSGMQGCRRGDSHAEIRRPRQIPRTVRRLRRGDGKGTSDSPELAEYARHTNPYPPVNASILPQKGNR